MRSSWLILLLLLPLPLHAVQCANPIGDITDGNWTEGAGDGDTVHFEELDEGITCSGGTDDTTTYWQSSNNPSADILGHDITSITDPAVDTGHVLRVRCAKSASGGREINLTFRLEQAFATIHSTCQDATNTNISNTWTTYTLALPTSCSSLITNYGDLDIEIVADVAGGGPGRRLFCSTSELEVPNAPASTVGGREGLLNNPIMY